MSYRPLFKLKNEETTVAYSVFIDTLLSVFDSLLDGMAV